MSRSISVLMGAAVVSTAAATILVAAAPPALAQADATPQEAMHKVCDGCHNTQIVMDTPKDYDAWHDTIQSMIDRGARGTPEEFDQIMQYLYENVTTVDVNHADEATLGVVLRAPQGAVSAIVARRAKAPFHGLDELIAAVPGLNADVLRAKRRMIFFN